MRPLLLVSFISAILSSCVSLRANVGAAVPSNGKVGVQAGLSIGFNVPVKDNYVAVTQNVGFGGPKDSIIWGQLGADWMAKLGRNSYRLGGRVGGRGTAVVPEDDSERTGSFGINGAYLFALGGDANQTDGSLYWG